MIKIRQETSTDHPAVFNLIRNAFASEAMSDQQEQYLVERLRKSEAFIPELSLVAEDEGRIVGHILLTRIKVRDNGSSFNSLALAPVSVEPEYQGKGIGGKLILESHDKARELGHESIVLLGHAEYYPRFGYQIADDFGIKLPFDVPSENCMVIELVENALKDVKGTVEYPKEFSE